MTRFHLDSGAAMARLWVLLPLFMVLSLQAAIPGDNLRFTRLLTDQGISIGAVEVVFQDSYGYMWFGGDAGSGLVQYDGYNFIIHRHKPGDPRTLSSSVVWDIYEDRSGDLWIATDAGINRFEREKGYFTRLKFDYPDLQAAAFTRAIVADEQGQLWIGSFGGLHRLDPATDELHTFTHQPGDASSLAADQIRTLFIDSDGGLWIGIDAAGLNYLDIETGQFRRYGGNSGESSGGSSDESNRVLDDTVRRIYQTRDGLIWVGTDGGLARINPETGQLKLFRHDPNDPDSLSNNIVSALTEDEAGNLWVGTEHGLNYFNRETGEFSVYLHNPNQPDSLANNVVRSLLMDANQNLWVGNFPAGVNFLDRAKLAFTTWRYNPGDTNSLSQSSVLSLHEDSKGNLWMGTDGGGLNYLDRETSQFRHYTHDPARPQSLSAGAVLSIEPESEHLWWLGTWGGGLNLFDNRTGKFVHYPQRTSPDAAAANVWALLKDRQGVLWSGTVGGGLNRYDRETGEFIWYHPVADDPHSLPSYVVWCLYEDHLGQLWAGTGEGLVRYRPESDDFVRYTHKPDDPDSLSFDTVTDITEDSQHRMWIATRGGGLNLYHRKTDSFSHVNESQGLASNVVVSVVVDDNGDIWSGTTNGLSRYTPATGEIRNYSQNNGLQGNQFNIGSAIKLRTGELVFGGIYGVNIFNPKAFKHTEAAPPVEIVEFKIFNKPVLIGVPGSPLSKAISQTDVITLTHKQSVFSFGFVAISYSDPEKNQYAYKLEGFENQWNYVGNRRTATYTNLNPGNYTFRVKASNGQGVWNEDGSSIQLRILPPPWQTWWAYCLYILVIIGLVASFVWAQHKKVANERTINRRLQQLDKLKDEFLANTSHELRTPLNGIIGLAESLIDGVGGRQTDAGKNNLEMIVASGKRLDRLVNDILDFSQLKESSLTLRQKPLDMHTLVQVVLALSVPLVGDKKLQLVNAIGTDVPQVFADEDRVQQILHNLVSNAIKFTHTGTVTVTAHLADADHLAICVHDRGIGIPEDVLPRIFDAFYQMQGSTIRQYSGTGLGLAVTRQLVELHGGMVAVESTPGQGSIFTFTLPLTTCVMSTDSNTTDLNPGVPALSTDDSPVETPDPDLHEAATVQFAGNTSELAKDVNAPSSSSSSNSSSNMDPAIQHILVVDDEPVNRQVLANHLQLQRYKVTQAGGGDEALALINQQHFDLILLDIMMPQVSGYEVCKQAREQFSSHELPIIFLTAKSQGNDLVTGFSLGANDFLTKPISRDELLARVNIHLQLLEVNRNLEKKVTERTEALQQKHQQLEKAYDQLEQISLSDPLTGLSNRRYLQKLIPMDIARVEREHQNTLQQRWSPDEPGHDFAFFLLDVDHFKSVNDLYGHNAGDQLLIQISTLLSHISRESDCVVRWGGEEFLIVSRFSRRSEAPQMAERIRRAVADNAFSLPDGQPFNKTCSIGFACYPFVAEMAPALSWEQVIDTADRALYAAKKSGRNRCVGLIATDKTPQAQLYQHISEDIRGLIERGEIAVIADSDKNLVWD